MKNGAKGIYCWWLRCAQIPPVMHAMINAHAMPAVPSHMPPTAINLMSPMPIGVSLVLLWVCMRLSNIIPISDAMIYPKDAPIIAVFISMGNLKKAVSISPINISGKRYLSGIILVR